MARKDSENQEKSMGLMFRGKEIFKPLTLEGSMSTLPACGSGSPTSSSKEAD